MCCVATRNEEEEVTGDGGGLWPRVKIYIYVYVESRLHETHWRAVNLLKKCVNQNGVFSKRSDGEIKYPGHISHSQKGPGALYGGRERR